MSVSGRRLPAALVALAGAGLGAPAGATPPAYYITDLGMLPGCNLARAVDLNAQGTVAGWCANSIDGNFDTVTGFTWTPATANGNVGVLAALDTGLAAVTAINDTGQVVGEKDGGAVLWNPGNPVPLTLPVPAGATHAIAAGINNGGRVIINTQTPAAGGFGVPGAAVWTPTVPNGTTGAVRGLGDLGAANEAPQNKGTFVQGINDAGRMVGSSLTTFHPTLQNDFAVLWEPGTTCGNGQASPCTTVGDLAGGATYASLNAINATGTAVGFGTIAGVAANGFLTRAMRSINGAAPSLLGGTGYLDPTDEWVDPQDINDAGVVVGIASDGEQTRPFYYSSTDGWHDLNDLVAADDPLQAGYTIDGALGINAAGNIVAYATHGGEVRAVLLTTLPPPPTAPAQVPLPPWLLVPLLAGLGALGVRGRRARGRRDR